MATRNFGPRHYEIDLALRQLAELPEGEASRMGQLWWRTPFLPRSTARRELAALARRAGLSGAWGAGRAYGGAAARTAARTAGVTSLLYSSRTRDWDLVVNAWRDAAGAAVVAHVADPALVDLLTEPVVRVCPSLATALRGSRP